MNLRALTIFVFIILLVGCGPYRVTYVKSRNEPIRTPTVTVERSHAHGLGPLILGGGLIYFLIHPISPPLFDYSGEVYIAQVCPPDYEIVETTHESTFGQNSLAAAISWFVIVDAYSPSRSVHVCQPPSP